MNTDEIYEIKREEIEDESLVPVFIADIGDLDIVDRIEADQDSLNIFLTESKTELELGEIKSEIESTVKAGTNEDGGKE